MTPVGLLLLDVCTAVGLVLELILEACAVLILEVCSAFGAVLELIVGVGAELLLEVWVDDVGALVVFSEGALLFGDTSFNFIAPGMKPSLVMGGREAAVGVPGEVGVDTLAGLDVCTELCTAVVDVP